MRWPGLAARDYRVLGLGRSHRCSNTMTFLHLTACFSQSINR